MAIFQTEIRLKAKSRGFHLITSEIQSALSENTVKTGLCHIHLKHTSASLTLNENADPTVREDFESHINKMVPENMPYYRHTTEGSDDMPAHIKSSLMGAQLTVPVTGGRMNLGTWQGIYLNEHRNHAGSRSLVITVQGE